MSQAIRARTSMLVRSVSGLTNYEYSFYLSPKSLVHKGPAQSHKLTLSLLYMFFSSQFLLFLIDELKNVLQVIKNIMY